MKKVITVGVCTLNKPNLLESCLITLSHVECPPESILHLIAVDNDPAQSAIEIVSKFPNITYKSFPGPDISAARNAVLEFAKLNQSTHIAFIDDDEIAPQDWIINMLCAIEELNCDVIIAPVWPIIANTAPTWIRRSKLLHPPRIAQSGEHSPVLSTNNSFIKTEKIFKHKILFSSAFSHVGGEDVDFFERVRKMGAVIKWHNGPALTESYPSEKLTLSYLLKRGFIFGHIRINVFFNQRSYIRLFAALIKPPFIILFKMPLLLSFRMHLIARILSEASNYAGRICATFRYAPHRYEPIDLEKKSIQKDPTEFL